MTVKYCLSGSTHFVTAAIVAGICASMFFPEMALGQDVATRKREELASVPKTIPSDLMLQLQMIGPRMSTVGKEETVFDGQFVNAAGQHKPLRVIHQISGVVRIESPEDKSELSFDGELPRGIRDHDGESLLDTFVSDSVEGMIYAVRNGGSMQLLGRGFVSDAKRPDPRAPRYDIYQVNTVDRTNKTSGVRTRRFYFDSQTGLLTSTRYMDRNGIAIETRFLDWGQADGSKYPSRIERYENGNLTFSFISGSVTARSTKESAISK